MRAFLVGLLVCSTPGLSADRDAGVPRAARRMSELTLLVFTSSTCSSCRRLHAGGALVEVATQLPRLRQQVVDVPTEAELVSRYGVEVTPTMVLIDADGFPLARPTIDLDDPATTAERILKLARKMAKD
jgi:thioredoxin-related protein